jgi:predicted metal-dependent phosphoesterase TrpH
VNDIREVFEAGEIDYIAITDHSRIELAYELKKEFGDKIIIGEEIMTTHGEIIGLFLEKEIPKFLSPEETVEEIRKQGGLVYIPHPFDGRRSGIEKYEKYEEILDAADIIEVYNSRCFTQTPNEEAYEYALSHEKLMAAASDAHGPKDIGVSFVEVAPFSNAVEFLDRMKNATLSRNKMHVRGFFSPTKSKIQKRLNQNKITH